ncbi:MATH and LRR domain-containing protein PFE0570w-like [Zerene cesonia]|uniref:MATH and LRR domain-containing protein PFE0570w-like n=1 Tax=Zerene cesonia TaxID=33412 RepID=UPI0018E522D5|nr:MATH and LRR domain-containing protein PFE0570w-like [Zerene cesonia]
MITDLNIEKDMLVIKSLQTQGRGFFNSIRNIHAGSNIQKSADNKKSRSKSPVKVDGKKEEQEKKVERTKDYKGSNKISETKENVLDDEPIKRTRKIMDRRKSVPAVSKILEDKKLVWSSEDENDKCNPLRHPRLSNINHSDRKSTRTSETSSMEDRYSCNSQTSKDLRYKRRSTRINDDNYESHFRSEQNHNRRYGSPERNIRNRALDNNSGQYKYDRRRSPPSDRYMRNKSRDRRSNYDKDSRFYDNHPRNSRSENHAMKHKLPHHFHLEEPSHKKLRIDSYGQYLSGDRDRGVNYKEHVDPSTALISPDDPYRSCQSPDHFIPESNDYYKIKEIMHTAATPLEDPRISSKNYILKTENNKAVLKTTSSQDIDIRMVDKSLWNLPKVIVPDALLVKPSVHNMSEELVDEFYMNIENLDLDMSLESGEIGSTDHEKEYENIIVKERHKSKQPDDQILHSYLDKPKNVINKYKIPKQKVRKNEENEEKLSQSEGKKEIKKVDELQDMILVNTKNLHSDDKICSQEITTAKPITDQSNSIDTENQVSSLGTVERDLLLSDDENMDLPKQKTSDEYKTDSSEKNTKQNLVANVSSGELKDKIGNLKQDKDMNKSTKRDKFREKTSKKKTVKDETYQESKNEVSNSKQENEVDMLPQSNKDKSCDNNTKKSTKDPVSNEESKVKVSNNKQEADECIKSKIDKFNENNSNKNTLGPVPCEEANNKVSNVKQEKETDKCIKLKKDKLSDIKTHNNTEVNISHEESKVKVGNLKEGKNVEKTPKTTEDNSSNTLSPKTIADRVSCQEIKDKIINQEKEVDDTVKSKQEKCNEKNTKKITIDTVSCDVLKAEVGNLNQEKERKRSTKTKKDSDTTTKEPRSKKSKKKLEAKSAEQNNDTVTKRSKSRNEKEDKTEEIKTKFSDLFGESNSLIMPEDLGITATTTAVVKHTNAFESIFDDTQSAVDMQLEQKEDKEKALENVQNVEMGHKQNIMDINSLKMDFNDDVNSIDVKKDDNEPEDKRNHDKELNIDNDNLYENLNPEVSMDGSNVVIISTGVQPDCVEDTVVNSNHITEDNKQLPPKGYSVPVLKALATSTPLKLSIEASIHNSDHTAKNATSQDSNIDSSNSSRTVEIANDQDLPDVRIFVKRRRKVKK